ncbi:hypothetical protein [Streptomyces avidinii]|uniref:MDMPI C-terminal domain-containing protein n=1 Tax=Streptomyces avidinii TaxID=1895 RepID=A0ABS4KXN1_STRAV|nr:hypothetical protein [Streptomyces avidinii]MBP2034788.1 hypothetical protein [Streptomyces avidinii]GGY88868.1 hypothetical protein GCM10010343_12550 [Streptomyces avidinii]
MVATLFIIGGGSAAGGVGGTLLPDYWQHLGAVFPPQHAITWCATALFTVCATPSAWPHKPTAFDFHAAEGRSWRLSVDGDGACTTRIPAPTAATGEDSDAAGASVHGTASELVLYLYDRIQADFLHVDGDAGLLDLLRAWEPEEK